MKQLFIMAAIAAFSFQACKSETTEKEAAPATASQYYEKVAELEETLSEPILTTEAAIKARGDKKDFAGVARSARAMEDSLDLRISALKKIDPVGKGGEDFKIVATRYFEYLKSIYTAYKKIGEAKTEEERIKGVDEMTNIINGQPAVMANLQSAQAKFAADNGFTINP